MPIGTGIVYNTGDLILSQVSSSGTAFLETKIAAATSSLIYFDSTARINSASLNSITVGTASYVSGSNSIVTNFTASNISASGTGSFGIVGIGTTSPATFLDVVGGNGSYPTSSGTVQATGSIVRLRNGNSNLVLDIGGNGGNGNWLQSTSRIDLSLGYPLLLNPNGGNVGVGTTSPQFLLDVVNTNTTSKLRIGNAGNNFGAQLILAGSNTTKNWVIANQQNLNGTLEFTQTTTTGSSTVDTTPAMVINSSGYVGIGTTSPSTYSSQVAIETSLTRGMMVFNTTLADAGTFYGLGFGYAMSNYNSAYIGFYKAGNANTSNRLFFSLWNQDNILNLTGLGYVGIGTTSPTTKLHITGSHVSGNGMSRFESSDYAIISLKTPSNGDGSDGYWGFRAQDTANNDLMFYGYRYKPTFSGFWVDPSFAGIISKGFFVRNSDGNVGIGTSSPANKLDVLGNISASIISSSRYYSAVPASFVSSFSTTGSTSAPGFTFELGSISQSHQPRGFIQVNDYYNSFNNGQNLQLKSFSNGVNYGGWMLMSNWGGTMRIGATGSSAYNANELPPTYMEVGTATVSLVGLTLSGTASWATNATTAQTANALNTANNYTITNLTANNITASSISSSFAYLSNIGFSDQTVTPDTSIFPTGSTSGGFILDGGVYTNGLYRTRFVKIDRSANLSLYIQETKGSSGSFSNLVRFGTHANSPNTFEVFGSTNIQGSITSSNFVGSHIGNTTGTASWATNALTASFLPVGTYNITSSWAQNVVSASFATTAQTANALNASNTYTVAGLTSAYVDVTGAGTIPTTGIYRPSTKTLGLSADGTLIFKISNVSSPATSSIETGNFVVQSGNVGIGTTNPTQKLDIVGSYGVAGDDSGILKIRGGFTDATQLNFGVSADGGYGWIQTTDVGLSNDRNIILNPIAGNVGIGTTSPVNKLQVAGNISGSSFTSSISNAVGFLGTSSWAQNVISASYALSSSFATTAQTANALNTGNSYTIAGLTNNGTLSQQGTLSMGSGYQILATTGTAPIPGIAFVGDTNTGIYSPGADTIGFSISGSEKVRINSNGYVGIGTTSPFSGAELDVWGDIVLMNQNWSIRGNNGNGDFAIEELSGSSFSDSNIKFYIASGGNVGIGTIVPTQKLEVHGNGQFGNDNLTNVGLRLTRLNGGMRTSEHTYHSSQNSPWYTYGQNLTWTGELAGIVEPTQVYRPYFEGFAPAAGYKVFGFMDVNTGSFTSANVINALAIKNNGNVGIGTTDPATKLHLSGTGSTELRITSTTSNTNSLLSFYELTLASWGIEAGQANGSFFIKDLYNTRTVLTLNSSGNVGIGTTSPGARLEISGSSNSALLNIKSPISGAIVYVSGSGAVGINTSNIGAYTLQVNGSFAATTKSFVIDHPTKAGKRLIYGSLESPYHGIRLTGRDTIKDGKCKVELPDYMYKLILHDSINIQLTGIKFNKTLYVDEINIPENYFTIAYDKGVFESYKDYDFFWDFTAIRADVPELNTEL